MHPNIIIKSVTIYQNVNRKAKTVSITKKKWYKIKASKFDKYKEKYRMLAEKEYGKNIEIYYVTKQKMSRKELRFERKNNPLHCEK